jgi:hypothetical protein
MERVIVIPAGTPLKVQLELQRLLHEQKTEDAIEILVRLATDTRMKTVWGELTRQDRKTGAFVHAARYPASLPVANDPTQDIALGETLFLAFRFALDRVAVSKESENAANRAKLAGKAARLRDMADELAEDGQVSADDIEALRRAANRYEVAASEIRKLDDALTIQNERGDRVERGVQTTLAGFFHQRFGNRLDGTAATLASVALGGQGLSPRASRSAFSRRKRIKKADC